MAAAPQLAPLQETWAEICRRHPDEWVCLVEVQSATDGAIHAARVIGHAPSMKAVLQQLSPAADSVITHTSGRPLRFPRLELTDELRDLVRPRR